MNYTLRSLAVALVAAALASCSSPSAPGDPYPGSGGVYLGTPRTEDIQSGRSVFNTSKFAPFKVGATTKQDVVKRLGAPAWWQSSKDGSSAMGYDFVRKEICIGAQKTERATFTFDSKLLLVKATYPRK